MPVAALLEAEEDPDVLREILRALGRIATPDALLALRRVAQGELRRLGKRPRTQAIESLAHAGAAATPILRALAQDSDPEIAGAARRALEGGVSG
jgi:HEAT repeat protein